MQGSWEVQHCPSICRSAHFLNALLFCFLPILPYTLRARVRSAPAPHRPRSLSSHQAHIHPRVSALAGLCLECSTTSHSPSDILLKCYLFFEIFPLTLPISLLRFIFLLVECTEYFTDLPTLLYVFPLEYRFHENRDFSPLYPQHPAHARLAISFCE